MSTIKSAANPDPTQPLDAKPSLFPRRFPYRAWSFCVIDNKPVHDVLLDRAIREAEAYRINRLEPHDYTYRWINYGIAYREYPKLRGMSVSQLFPGHPVDVTATARESIREAFRKIKAKGLKLNVWYHVGRDVPKALNTAYPEYADPDTGFVYTFEENCLTEFFELYPEVDGITVTSLHETDSILTRPGKEPRQERLLKLYLAIHRACKKAGREFILRDFIARMDDYHDFIAILKDLPHDVILMTKEILGDWYKVNMELNPFLPRYIGRRVVVEFDLWGQYQGQGRHFFYADPEYFWRTVRQLMSLGVEGAVGRLYHPGNLAAGEFAGSNAGKFTPIFDTLGEANVSAFSRTLFDTGETIETSGEHHWNHGSDIALSQWTRSKAISKLPVEAIVLLQKYPALTDKALSICGYFSSHALLTCIKSAKKIGYDKLFSTERHRFDPIWPDGSLEKWVRNSNTALRIIRAEKDDLVTTTDALRQEARLLAERNSTDWAYEWSDKSAATKELAERCDDYHWVALGCRAIALIYTLGLVYSRNYRELEKECREGEDLAQRMRQVKGADFCDGLPEKIELWVKWARSARKIRTMQYTSRPRAEAVRWQAELRAELFRLMKIDDLSARKNPMPLEARRISAADRGAFDLREIEFNSTASRRIRALVGVPRQRPGKCPAVVCIHGHGGTAESVFDPAATKESTVYRRCAAELSERGHVTIAANVGQHQVYEPGRTLMGERLWDLMRCVDYLETMPEVDAQRIGCAGLSLGGEMSMYLGALDERIRATQICGWLSQMDEFAETGCKCWKYPGLTELADFADIAALTAPRALRVQAGSKDTPFFAVPGNGNVMRAFEEVRVIYGDFGCPDRVGMDVHDEADPDYGGWGHLISVPLLMAFFERHLG